VSPLDDGYPVSMGNVEIDGHSAYPRAAGNVGTLGGISR
jgi:hypothetical protein